MAAGTRQTRAARRDLAVYWNDYYADALAELIRRAPAGGAFRDARITHPMEQPLSRLFIITLPESGRKIRVTVEAVS